MNGGEGSKGGRIIGHTASGKPIYATSRPSSLTVTGNYRSSQSMDMHTIEAVRGAHPHFKSAADHEDAANAMKKQAQIAREDYDEAKAGYAKQHGAEGLKGVSFHAKLPDDAKAHLQRLEGAVNDASHAVQAHELAAKHLQAQPASNKSPWTGQERHVSQWNKSEEHDMNGLEGWMAKSGNDELAGEPDDNLSGTDLLDALNKAVAPPPPPAERGDSDDVDDDADAKAEAEAAAMDDAADADDELGKSLDIEGAYWTADTYEEFRKSFGEEGIVEDGIIKASGPFIGPHGGKWADPDHKIPWHEKKHAGKPAPVAKPHDEVAAVDLHAAHENHGKLAPSDYHRASAETKGEHHLALQKEAIHANLVNKLAAGKYDHAQATKLFAHHAKAIAEHQKVHSGASYDPATRMAAAKKMADTFHAKASAGELDHLLTAKNAKAKAKNAAPSAAPNTAAVPSSKKPSGADALSAKAHAASASGDHESAMAAHAAAADAHEKAGNIKAAQEHVTKMMEHSNAADEAHAASKKPHLSESRSQFESRTMKERDAASDAERAARGGDPAAHAKAKEHLAATEKRHLAEQNERYVHAGKQAEAEQAKIAQTKASFPHAHDVANAPKIGQSSRNKPIFAHPAHPGHASFIATDHDEAAAAHASEAKVAKDPQAKAQHLAAKAEHESRAKAMRGDAAATKEKLMAHNETKAPGDYAAKTKAADEQTKIAKKLGNDGLNEEAAFHHDKAAKMHAEAAKANEGVSIHFKQHHEKMAAHHAEQVKLFGGVKKSFGGDTLSGTETNMDLNEWLEKANDNAVPKVATEKLSNANGMPSLESGLVEGDPKDLKEDNANVPAGTSVGSDTAPRTPVGGPGAPSVPEERLSNANGMPSLQTGIRTGDPKDLKEESSPRVMEKSLANRFFAQRAQDGASPIAKSVGMPVVLDMSEDDRVSELVKSRGAGGDGSVVGLNPSNVLLKSSRCPSCGFTHAAFVTACPRCHSASFGDRR